MEVDCIMKKKLLKILVCPLCKSSLKLTNVSSVGEEIKEGVLKCVKCSEEYDIIDYVPRMLAISERGEKDTQSSFSRQWLNYKYGKYLWSYDEKGIEKLVKNQIGLQENQFENKIIIDVGCGNGVITNFFTKYGGEVIGIDLSYSVFMAAEHFKKNKNLHFVQGSLFHPPFRDETFDLVYSSGVIHHTYDTKKAFESIARLCKKKGVLYVWLYGNYRTSEKIFNMGTNFMRFFISKMTPKMQDITINAISIPYSFVRYYFKKIILKKPAVKYNKNQLFHTMRDRFTPIYAHISKMKDVINWFEENGFENITPTKVYGISIKGKKK